MWKVPNVGQQLTLEFINPYVPVKEIPSKITDLLKDNFSKFNLSNQLITGDVQTSTNKSSNNSESGHTVFFFIVNGYVSITTHLEDNMVSLEVKLNSSDDRKSNEEISNFEILFNSLFGWENSTGNAMYARGGSQYHLLNKYYHSETMYRNFKLIHREETKFQDLRIYDTLEMGRVLSLDFMIQNSDAITDDNYTIDLCSLVLQNDTVKENTEFNHILLIGAGDMIIPDYILKKFSNVKKITMVEIDDRVIENTKKYFAKFYENIDNYIKEGRLDVIVDDGAKYLRENVESNKLKFDGVIIDNSDVYLFEGPAANLFTKDFYTSIFNSLNKGAFFCQQVSDEQVKSKWTDMVKSVGFNTLNFKYSITPEYSTALPLGSAMKD